MPTITDLATTAIHSFPSLYPTRISFLISVFSSYGGGGVEFDETTGGYVLQPGAFRDEPEFEEITEKTLARVKRMQEQAAERWISEHAEELAKDSTFDEATHLNELRWPTTAGWSKRELAWEELNTDTQNAFREVLYAYDRIYDDALRLRDWKPARDGNRSKTWDLTNPTVSKILLGAQVLMERLTGQTRDERQAEQMAHMDKIIAEMKTKGTW
jgi:hypothetical protein